MPVGTAPQVGALARQLPPGEFYFPLGVAQEALRNETMFNVIDLQSRWEVDRIPPSQAPPACALEGSPGGPSAARV
jgi:hypothetical protein